MVLQKLHFAYVSGQDARAKSLQKSGYPEGSRSTTSAPGMVAGGTDHHHTQPIAESPDHAAADAAGEKSGVGGDRNEEGEGEEGSDGSTTPTQPNGATGGSDSGEKAPPSNESSTSSVTSSITS